MILITKNLKENAWKSHMCKNSHTRGDNVSIFENVTKVNSTIVEHFLNI